jgi:hypothetical protein
MGPLTNANGLQAATAYEWGHQVDQAAGDLVGIADGLAELARQSSGPRTVQLRSAVYALGNAVSALCAAADIECNIVQPPAPVDTRPRGPNNDMVTQCTHDPTHCWDGIGINITCP